jgi:type II secretory pathway predicted ATPase ExeA
MYDSFYGLKDRPFSLLPDPGFLYLSKKHQMALTMLEYALYNNAGFCIISGEIGAGKTTLLRKLLENMEDHISVGMITNTHSSFGELLDWVLSAFNIHQPGLNKVEMHQIFLEFLLQQYSKKKTVLLIVDEAQNLSVQTLEELRMLSNINTGKDQLLQVILAGQPELKDTLRLPELKQFAQRIAVDYHLGALSIEETFGYIRHRLKTAGATKDIFTPLACERIHLYSGGVPRLINLLCDTSMVYGFADQAEVIDENLVDEMVRERMSDSLVPIVQPVDSETEKPKPSATSSGASAQGTTTSSPPSKLSQISPEHKKQPASPNAEKKTVADIRQPVALHPQAQASGAQLKAVAAQLHPDPEEQEEAIQETALYSEPEITPETSSESAVESETEPAAETSVKLDDTTAEPSLQPETVKQRLVNKIEVLKVVASEPESSLFGNKWIMGVLLILALSVVFLLIRNTSSDSTPPAVKTKASVVSSPQAATVAPVTTTAAQPAADMDSAAAARKKAIEAARQAAEQREAQAKVRRGQEAAAEAKVKAEMEAKAKIEAEARAAAAAKAKAEQERVARLKQAAAARKAERDQAAAKARTAALEAKLKAEQEDAARARKQAAAAEAKAQQAQAQARELQLKAQTSQTAPAVTTSSAAASAKLASKNAQNVDPELEFTTDPCQGPSAKFLSTCHK